MRICVLGPLAVDGVTAAAGPRDRVVLEALTLRHGSVSSAEQLADAIWPELPPASWNKVVHGCVMRLRRLLGSDTIETTPQGYRLTVPHDEVDAYRFARLTDRGRELLTLGDPERARHALGEGLALWRGRPYADLDEWDPARIETQRLEELRFGAEELAIESALLTGHHQDVLAEAQAAAYREPLRERRWALLARADYQSGRQAEALQTLQRARALLVGEAGLDPGPELLELESAILRQDPSLSARPAGLPPSARCPYLGLVPYGVEDSEAFFGRDRVVADCLQLLDREGVVVVVGPSGSGKSSVVRAGVAATLARQGRQVSVVTPDPRHPADALTGLPADPALVVVVDQCEAALLREDAEETLRFLDELTALTERIEVVVAMRADRLGDVSNHAGFARIVERGLLLLGSMDETELRAAIEEPARGSGLLLEAGLVDLLVREVEGEPGALPLLSHSLRRTWERREGGVLTVEGYHQTGGLRSAVARSAEQLYGGLAEDHQTAVRDLMLRLVTPTPEGDPVRSPVPRRLLSSDSRHERVIEMLVDSRLVTTDGATVELAHEALIRAWPRLRTWLDDDVEGQRIMRHLTLAADNWDGMERPESELYRGLRLRAALEWRDKTDPALTHAENAFLDAGRTADEQASQDAARRAEHQAQVNRRLRTALGAAAVLFVLALVAASVAVVAADRARTGTAEAEQARGLALAAASLNTLEDDQSLALLMAVESQRLSDSGAAQRALLTSLFAPAFSRTVIPTGAPDYLALAVDARERVAVAKRSDGALDVIDLKTRAVRFANLPSPPSPLEGVSVQPSGRLAVSSGLTDGDASVVVYDLESGDVVKAFPGKPGEYYWAAFSPDGKELAVADGRGRVRVYDTDTWDERIVLHSGKPGGTSTIEYDASGRHLFVATFDLVSPDGGAVLTRFATRNGKVLAGPARVAEPLISSIAVLPGSAEIAVVGRAIQRYSAISLRPVGDPFGPNEIDGLVSLTAAPDGLLIAGSPIDMKVYRGVGQIGPAQPEETTFDRGSPGVELSSDGSSMVSADIDGTISTWSVDPFDQLGTPLRPAGTGLVSASPDGSVLAVWGEGREVQLYDRISLEHLGGLSVGAELSLTGVDFSPDGARLAVMTCPRDVDPCPAKLSVWDISTRQVVAGPVDVHDAWAFAENSVVFVLGGDRIATAGGDGVVRLWDAQTLEPLRPGLDVSKHTNLPSEVVYGIAATETTGQSLLAAQDEQGQSVVWEVTKDGATPLGALENALRLGFSPDGLLVTSSGQGTFVLRDPLSFEVTGPTFPAEVPPTSYSFTTDAVPAVVSTSGGFGTQLWDRSTGKPLSGVMPAFRSALAPDGATIYLGAGPVGRNVQALSLLPDDLVEMACQQAGRNMTDREWGSLMGPDEPQRATCAEWPS